MSDQPVLKTACRACGGAGTIPVEESDGLLTLEPCPSCQSGMFQNKLRAGHGKPGCEQDSVDAASAAAYAKCPSPPFNPASGLDEQIEYLEAKGMSVDRRVELIKENKRLREALEFYTDGGDGGERARAALKETNGSEK